MADFSNFSNLDIRVGKILEANEFPEAKVPSYKLKVDFGSGIGIKNSSAHITNYNIKDLEGKRVIGVVNFPPKQVGHFLSEVLILGVMTDSGVKLLSADDIDNLELGSKIG
ncbi:tRNA-binding protein [Candidatus Mancarchaeum acidiphilum]|nr:tRNA-binding protein [Candidatus Mancarchaeum acidiphilum]